MTSRWREGGVEGEENVETHFRRIDIHAVFFPTVRNRDSKQARRYYTCVLRHRATWPLGGHVIEN